MNGLRFMMIVGALGLLGLLYTGCVKCPEPEPFEERFHPIVHQIYEEASRDQLEGHQGYHPSDSPITVEVVSDSQVRITYERDGQEVVEIYTVSDHHIFESML